MSFKQTLGVSILIGTLILTAFVARLEIICNDDTFVYFTYAKNIVQGRLFAYDSRNIPSEGFTSLLYLAMLLPFEKAGVNMTLAAAVLSIAGLLLTALVAALALYRWGLSSKQETPLYAALLLFFLLINENALVQVGRGLDTAWGFIFVLLAIHCLCQALPRDQAQCDRSRFWIFSFFLALFVSLLCRPENLVYSGLLILVLFALHPRRRVFLAGLSVFSTLLLLLAAFKMAVFKDLFPTAYYRKIPTAVGAFPGWPYVRDFFQRSSLPPILTVAGITVYAARALRQGGRLADLGRSVLPALLVLLCALVNVVSMLKIEPLVGYAFRFLFVLQCATSILLALLIVRGLAWFAELLAKSFPRLPRLPAGAVLVLALGTLALMAVPSKTTPRRLATQLDLRRKADLAVERHRYIRFGRFMRERVVEHEQVMMVFGDAGAIPYAFECRFLDTNGLTEPFIARLFRETDPAARAARYSEYVLSHDPDIVVLSFGALQDGAAVVPSTSHGPFGGPIPIGVFEDYRRFGLRYLLSLPMYYDLHIGVNPRSPRIAAIVGALEEYAAQNKGYRIEAGLTIRSGDRQVHFDAYPAGT